MGFKGHGIAVSLRIASSERAERPGGREIRIRAYGPKFMEVK